VEQRVRNLTSPVSDEQLRNLRPGEDVVQIGRPLAEADVSRVSEFLALHPNAWLRVYSVPGSVMRSLDWLKGLVGLRRLWLDLLEKDEFHPTIVSSLPADLEALYLPGLKGKFDCEALRRLPRLRQLSLSGTISDLSAILRLDHLQHLTLFRVKTNDLQGLVRHPRLESLKLHHARMKSLRGLDEIPSLRILRILDCAISNIAQIGSTRRLELLEVAVCKSLTGLPSLVGLGHLAALRIAALSPRIKLGDILHAPALETLCLDDFSERETEQLDRLPDGHPSLRRVFFGFQPADLASSIEARLRLRLERGMEKMPFGAHALDPGFWD
jgi:Leucine-rich repeat (LRR) protein